MWADGTRSCPVYPSVPISRKQGHQASVNCYLAFLHPSLTLQLGPLHRPGASIKASAREELGISKDLRLDAELAVIAQLTAPRDVTLPETPEWLPRCRLPACDWRSVGTVEGVFGHPDTIPRGVTGSVHADRFSCSTFAPQCPNVISRGLSQIRQRTDRLGGQRAAAFRSSWRRMMRFITAGLALILLAACSPPESPEHKEARLFAIVLTQQKERLEGAMRDESYAWKVLHPQLEEIIERYREAQKLGFDPLGNWQNLAHGRAADFSRAMYGYDSVITALKELLPLRTSTLSE